jgi:uncharacterized delta-60 repeat protein
MLLSSIMHHDSSRRRTMVLTTRWMAVSGLARCLLVTVCSTLVVQPAKGDGGVFDLSFGTGGQAKAEFGGAFDEVRGMAVQPDGKIIAVGTGGSSNRFGIARFLPSGALDPSFNGTGQRIIGESAGSRGVALLPNGRIIVAMPYLTSPNRGFQVYRLTPNGSIDTSFGNSGRAIIPMGTQPHVNALLIRPDGQILVGGYSSGPWDWGLAQFTAAGEPDASFGIDGLVRVNVGREGYSQDDFLTCMEVMPDGRIVAGGLTGSAINTGDRYGVIARFLPEGQLDPSFGTGGKVYTPYPKPQQVNDLAVLPNGQILAVNGAYHGPILFRLNVDGSLDTCFADQGGVPASTLVPAVGRMALDADGRIVVTTATGLARFHPDGTLDVGFGVGGRATPPIPFGSILELLVGTSVDTDFALSRCSVGSSIRLAQFRADVRDAEASTSDGQHFSVIDGGTDINVFRSDALGLERRGILEFDLRAVPQGAVPTAARLELTLYTFTYSSGSYPVLQFYGYAGDGVLTPGDVALSAHLLGESLPIMNLGPLNIPITNLQFVQDLMNSGGSWLGMVAYGGVSGHQAGFFTSEETRFGEPPVLVLDYLLPVVPTDDDADGDVDIIDLEAFVSCVSGPAIPFAACCAGKDFDADGDVDQSDFGILQGCFSGAERLGDPACAD